MMISALMIGAQQCHPPVLPICAQQCRLQVPSSATHLCAAVPPTCAQQCHPSVPSSAASQCPAVLSVSASSQRHPSVPLIS
ncbi:unnamed protein product, partial [Staurois parvus]